jgi:hypothetical protein
MSGTHNPPTATCRRLCDGELSLSADKECRARVAEAGCSDAGESLHRCVHGCTAAGKTSPHDCKERCADIYSKPCGDGYVEACAESAPKWGRKLCYDTCTRTLEDACVLAVDVATEAGGGRGGAPRELDCSGLCGAEADEYHGMARVMRRLLVGRDLPFSGPPLSRLVTGGCLEACQSAEEGDESSNFDFAESVRDFCSRMVGEEAGGVHLGIHPSLPPSAVTVEEPYALPLLRKVAG